MHCCWARRWRWKSSVASPIRARVCVSQAEAIDSGAARRTLDALASFGCAGRGMSDAGDFLAAWRRRSRARSAAAQATLPARELRARIAGPAAPRRSSRSANFDLIAEVKLRSPAVGSAERRPTEEDVGARVATYARAGAAAVSILTEPSRFDGSLEDLRIRLPCARAAGGARHAQGFPGRWRTRCSKAASRVPVACSPSCACCRAPNSNDLIDTALALDMFVLLEAFDAARHRAGACAGRRRAARIATCCWSA